PPYPARMALTTYSERMYAEDWEPWDGHGWWTYGTAHSMDWYDDGVTQGIVVALETPEGWVNTTIQPAPPPPMSFPNGTISISSTSTHDGNNINPGDLIWLQTCTVDVDPGCALVNGNSFSFAIVDTVNPATGSLTFHITSSDPSSGTHTPV